MNNIKNENYIVIQGFMVNELNLKGNELLIYAIIYGFSQLESQEFNGTLQYLADWCNSTKQGVLKALKSLIDKGLIEKKENKINNISFILYHTTKFNTIKQSLTGDETKFNGGIKQSLTGGVKQSLINDNIDINNINNNINNNIIDNINEETNKEAVEITILSEEEKMFEEFWNLYPKKIAKQQCLTAYKRIPKLKQEHLKIIEAVKRFMQSEQWNKSNGQFIPNPLTFIHQSRWNDICYNNNSSAVEDFLNGR